LLETIREYGEERLDEAGQTDRWQARHADYYVDVLKQIRHHDRREEVFWAVRLSAEQDNLLAAWYWALDTRNIDTASGNARLRRPARHAVLKSATTKINYKKREAARDSGDPTMMMMAIEMAIGTPWPARWESRTAHERQLSNLWTCKSCQCST
jgi:hypothetical protein